jgi:hypothetical protein
MRRERRMAKIEDKKPGEEAIPQIRVSFSKATYMMQPDKGLENLGQKLSIMNINTLEEDEVKGDAKRTKPGKEDEVLPQLTIHNLEKISTKTFV